MTERKVAIITAAAGAGIGGATAKRLAGDGYDVVVTDKHAERAEKFALSLTEEHGRDFSSWQLDVADPDSVHTVFTEIAARCGRIDLLVNNAGFSVSKPIVELTVDDWKKCVDIDLNGTFYCTREVLPHMIKQGSGNIINLSSTAAWQAIPDHGAPYSAAKAAVLALTRVTAAEAGKHGIRVNAVAPGLIYNDFLKKIYPDDFFDGYADRRTFLGRLGRPEDIASMIAFLASDEASYVTGEVYGVSGGSAPHA